MNVNKKLGRFKQWAGEKMGGEAKTDTSEDFKNLEAEMDLRYEGMDKMQRSMTTYVKWVGRRTEDKDKLFPTTQLGQTLVAHGQDYAPESDYGQCLTSMGRANENIGRKQEAYLANSTSAWLEGLERSLAQMKEYQAARKKLENRRIAYDASLVKVQKAKKEDFRVEEELRAQKAKYEEASEDTYRRMMDIKDAEVDSIADLTAFLDAELAYYDGCRDLLQNLKREWAGHAVVNGQARTRPRANTAKSFSESHREDDSPAPRDRDRDSSRAPILPSRPGGRASPPAPPISRTESLNRPGFSRSATGESDASAQGIYKLVRIPTEPTPLVHAHRAQLKPVNSNHSHDYSDDRSESPVSRGMTPVRTTSWGNGSPASSWGNVDSGVDRGDSPGPKKTIPPPINRAKKPAPPPPMKRSTLSASQVPQYN